MGSIDKKMADDMPAEIVEHVTVDAFRSGMAQLAGAVNIVTTDGPAGRAGFTASAVCSVTDSPPTLLVCINRGASAAPAFLANDVLCVNTVGPAHQDIAMLFGGKTAMDTRFEKADWLLGKTGAPIMEGAIVAFDCKVSQRTVVGTHEVIFAEVIEVVETRSTSASVYWGRKFHELKL